MKNNPIIRRGISLETIFKALGHPVRLKLVRAVTNQERCACDLVELVKLAGSTVSRHLGILREAGIINEEKRGQKVFYRLQLRSVANFIAYMENPAFRKKVDAFVDASKGVPSIEGQEP